MTARFEPVYKNQEPVLKISLRIRVNIISYILDGEMKTIKIDRIPSVGE